MQSCRYARPWICPLFACMGGCFGCFTRIQGRTAKKHSIDNFWSTSSGEIDNNSGLSRTMSSISASNQSLNPINGSCCTNNPSEFVNHGLLLWNQTRQQWLANKSSQNRKEVLEPTISWNASYESLLGTSKPFAQPVPLAEMVDFLVDVWEQEGLYD
ncbi:uncharacterized protein LOC123200545 isoform X2 [Mangifera indica]|uniref:uncharacterized protein LOC123200545 isoform X2 n=1 Tax=Mangifera indica TaxID=29780 RepID=UPI001CFAEBDE|nr:uncharacterized protein LOC123200545 isoform X2 [Mangifera indica]